MTIGRRRGPARRLTAVTLAFVAAGAASLTFQSSAHADGVGAKITQAGINRSTIVDSHGHKHAPGLFELTADNPSHDKLLAYCIDLHHSTGVGVGYTETVWDKNHPGPKADQLNWVLHHSYPQVSDLAALATTAKVTKLSASDAVAGTQAAIWHFSDGIDLKTDDGANSAAVIGLYNYLTGPANVGMGNSQPLTLDVSPANLTGKAGGKIGDYTVTTSASSVKLAEKLPAGVKLMNGTAAAGATVKNNDKLSFQVPAGVTSGEASFTVTGTAHAQSGQVFRSTEGQHQELILAQEHDVTVTKTAKASWTPTAPSGLSAEAKTNCATGGLDVTLTNNGEVPATFTVNGEKVTVEAHGTGSKFVSIKQGSQYSVEVSGPGYKKAFTGTLACEVTPSPSPTKQGSTLPVTGASTALVVGLGALLLGGGAMMVFTAKRRRNAHER